VYTRYLTYVSFISQAQYRHISQSSVCYFHFSHLTVFSCVTSKHKTKFCVLTETDMCHSSLVQLTLPYNGILERLNGQRALTVPSSKPCIYVSLPAHQKLILLAIQCWPLTLSLLMFHICGVSKTFGEWYQKTNKTEDANK
jgi:hypothetical protein